MSRSKLYLLSRQPAVRKDRDSNVDYTVGLGVQGIASDRLARGLEGKLSPIRDEPPTREFSSAKNS